MIVTPKTKIRPRILWAMLLLLLFVVLSVSLAACGDDETSTPASTEETVPTDAFVITPAEGMELVTEGTRSFTLYVEKDTERVNLESMVTAKDVWDVVAEGETAPCAKDALVIHPERAQSGLGQGFTIFYGPRRNYTIRLYIRYLTYVELTFEGLPDVIMTVRKGATAQAPDARPEKEGYTFSGWDFDFLRPVNETTYITARWVANTYTVTLDAAGGKVSPATVKVTYGMAFTLPTPTRDNYTFLGWRDGEVFLTDTIWSYAYDVTLKAAWSAYDYRLTFDAAGGTVQPASIGVSYGETYELPTPERNGYLFDGWYADGKKVTGNTYPYQKNMIYVAHWIEEEYTVVYVTNGGDPMESEKLLFTKIGQAVPHREGYTFKGWFYDPGFTQSRPVAKDGVVTAYAYWGEETITSAFSFLLSDAGATITAFSGNGESCMIPAMIGGKPVIAIGKEAFAGNTRLYYISFPSTVKTLGEGAFSGCTALRRLNYTADGPYINLSGITAWGKGVFRGCGFSDFSMPTSLTTIPEEAFAGCEMLATFDFGSRVTAIGNNAFADCTSLQNVTLPASVSTLGSGVFRNCTALYSLTLPQTLRTIPDFLAEGCLTLSSVINLDKNRNLVSIGEAAFRGCIRLASLTLPTGITSFGPSVFEGCLNLTEITIPNGVSVLSDRLFAECQKLKSILIRGRISTIGIQTFMNCAELASFPFNGVVTIGEEAFRGCRGLQDVLLSATVTTLGQGAFAGCTRLTYLTIPASLTEIPASAFEGCEDLSTVTAHDGILSVGTRAFAQTHLTAVPFLSGVRTIGEEAFLNCVFIETLQIGKDLLYIGSRAFGGCSSLRAVVFEGTSERWKGAVAQDAFADCISYSGRPTILGSAAENLCDALLPNAATGCYWALGKGENGPVAVLRFAPNSVFYRNLVVDGAVSAQYRWTFVAGEDGYVITHFDVFDTGDGGGYVTLDLGSAGFLFFGSTARYTAQLMIHDASAHTLLYMAELGELVYNAQEQPALTDDPGRTDTKRLTEYTADSGMSSGSVAWNDLRDDDVSTAVIFCGSQELIFRTGQPQMITSYSLVMPAGLSCWADAVPQAWTLYGGRVLEDGTVEYVEISSVSASAISFAGGREYNFKVDAKEAFTLFKLEFSAPDTVILAELQFYLG